MKHFFSVHEFSEISGVEASTLRYWDDIGLFSPIKRDPENNYRYYSLEQLLALNFVCTLRDLDFPLKTIAELRSDRAPENLLTLLEKQERQLDMELRNLRLRSSIIHARQELIRLGLRAEENSISVIKREERALILWPRNEYEEGNTFMEPLATFVNQASDLYINLSFPVGGYWDDLDSFIRGPGRPDHFISIDPIGTHIMRAGDYLAGYCRGYYGEMGDLPERMGQYVKDNSINITGPVYTMYLHEEIATHDPEQYLAQVCVAISHKKRRKQA